jgi:hypothetical protein
VLHRSSTEIVVQFSSLAYETTFVHEPLHWREVAGGRPLKAMVSNNLVATNQGSPVEGPAGAIEAAGSVDEGPGVGVTDGPAAQGHQIHALLPCMTLNIDGEENGPRLSRAWA